MYVCVGEEGKVSCCSSGFEDRLVFLPQFPQPLEMGLITGTDSNGNQP